MSDCAVIPSRNDVLRIQTELSSDGGLLGVVDDQELVGAVVLGLIDAIGAQGVLNPQLGGIHMLRTLEDGGGADLVGGTAGGNDQFNVAVAVVHDLSDAVVQEADADHALAGAHVLGGTGAGLGVDVDVLIQIQQVLDALVMAILLNHGVDDQLGRAGGVVVGGPDQALILGLQQIGPVLGRFQTHPVQLVLVDHEAQDALVDAVPVAIRIPVGVAEQVGSVLCLVGHQQTGSSANVVRIGGAAEPDIGGGSAVFFFDFALHLTGGQTLILYFDAVQLFKLFAGYCQIFFLTGTVDDQLALRLSGGDQLIHVAVPSGFRSIGSGGDGGGSGFGRRSGTPAGSQAQNHQES